MKTKDIHDRALHSRACHALPIGKGAPWLAPLAGYSDLPFRLLCRELGASVACTEMVSAKGLVLGQNKKNNATNDLLVTYPPILSSAAHDAQCVLSADVSPPPAVSDAPLVVQLFGAESVYMEEAVHMLIDRGYSWFDCNMGCSVPKVNKSGSGSAMMRDLDNALAVAEAMLRAAGRGKVGFKMRLGQEPGAETYLELATRLDKAGAGWLTLHPRYAKQKFTGAANWEAVKPMADAVSIPVMVSGDLFSAEDGVNALAASNAAGVMFARGAMQNPAIFDQFKRLAMGSEASPPKRGSFVDGDRLEYVIRRHAALIRAFCPERRNRQGIASGLLKMRTFVPRYVKECAGARALRRGMAECASWDAMNRLLDDFFTHKENLLYLRDVFDAQEGVE